MSPLLALLIACNNKDPGGGFSSGAAEVSVAEVPDLVTAVTITSTLSGELALRCEGGDEVHERITSDDPILLSGLLAETDYQCELDGEGFSFTTGALPEYIPEMVQSGDPELAGGYTLFNHVIHGSDAEEQKLLMVDPQGRVRWYYLLPERHAGDMDVSWLGDGQVLYGGGYGAAPTVVGVDSQVVWQAPLPYSGGLHHHHAEPWEGGVVSLATETTTREEPASDGKETFQGFRIEQIDEDGALLWDYSCQELVPHFTPGDSGDPYHANWLGEVDGSWWLSLRNADAIVAIDSEGTYQWRMGPRSGFELRYPDGSPAPDSEWFYGQHAPEVDFPRMLVHDNGVERDGGVDYSRVAEYEIDLEARVVTLLWSWTEDNWYEYIWGDVDRLESGRILITKGHCSSCSSHRDGQHSALIEVDPETDQVVWRLDFSGTTDGLYRAQRVGACEAFHNRTLCPD